MQVPDILFIIVLIFSIILHEVAHGYAADVMGDPTPRIKGRLTLNPLPHIDILGSLVIPGLLILSGSPFLVGWAKPVPFNVFNLKNRKWGPALVAIAGPATNVLIAIIFASVISLFGNEFSVFMLQFMHNVIIINLVLAIFNLIPIPPLDGHHILFAVLPDSWQHFKHALGKSSFVILVLFIMFGWQFIQPIVLWVYRLLVSSPIM